MAPSDDLEEQPETQQATAEATAEATAQVSSQASADFQSLAGDDDPGIVREFLEFLRDNKKWWLAPILVTMLLLIGLAFLTASPAAPFIYSLF